MVVNPVTRRPFRVGELRRLGLADDHEAQVDEALDGRRGRLLRRIELRERAGGGARLQALQVEDVLDGQAQPRARFFFGLGVVETRGDGDSEGVWVALAVGSCVKGAESSSC